MPITIPDGLPAKGILEDERIFALEEDIAAKQNIRPLQMILVNLMPKKIETETQILRLISKSPIQVNFEFMQMASHQSHNTPADHLVKFYRTFDELSDRKYDGMIITGAPVEEMAFEDVDYWDEICRIFDWSRENVFSTIHICWGALAGLYHGWGIRKRNFSEKLFGVFEQQLCDEYQFLTNGFDELFLMPHSRHAGFDEEDLHRVNDLQTLAYGGQTGSSIVATPDLRSIYVTGHFEYGKYTLRDEYERDRKAGMSIKLPQNYYPHDDPSQEPILSWRSHANLLYRNWVNYVYQMTPYNLDEINSSYEGYRYNERVWHCGAHRLIMQTDELDAAVDRAISAANRGTTN